MKSSSVRGTPYRFVSADGGQGFNPTKTPESAAGGTPLNNAIVNDDDQKTVSRDNHGVVIDTQAGVDMNNPESNGNGVLFNGVVEGKDYTPWGNENSVLDSPVPQGAQRPSQNSSNLVNAVHNGTGKDFAANQQIPDQILKVGGVISRGMGDGSAQ